MWKYIKRTALAKKFIKPNIKAWLLKSDQVRVDFTNTAAEEAIMIAYAIIQQLAVHMRMDKRALLNKMLKMDAGVVRMKKQQLREQKYGKKN